MFTLYVLYVYATINHGDGVSSELCVTYGFPDQASAQAAGEQINMTKQIPIPEDPIDPAAVSTLGFMVLPLYTYAAPTSTH